MKWLVCLMVLIAMAGCKSGGESTEPTPTEHSVRFEVVPADTGTTADISYCDANEDTIQLDDVTLPWHCIFSVPSGRLLYLRGAASMVDSIYGAIEVDGQIVMWCPYFVNIFELEYLVP